MLPWNHPSSLLFNTGASGTHSRLLPSQTSAFYFGFQSLLLENTTIFVSNAHRPPGRGAADAWVWTGTSSSRRGVHEHVTFVSSSHWDGGQQQFDHQRVDAFLCPGRRPAADHRFVHAQAVRLRFRREVHRRNRDLTVVRAANIDLEETRQYFCSSPCSIHLRPSPHRQVHRDFNIKESPMPPTAPLASPPSIHRLLFGVRPAPVAAARSTTPGDLGVPAWTPLTAEDQHRLVDAASTTYRWTELDELIVATNSLLITRCRKPSNSATAANALPPRQRLVADRR